MTEYNIQITSSSPVTQKKPFAIYSITKHGAIHALKLARSLQGADLYVSDKVRSHLSTSQANVEDTLALKQLPLPMGDFLKEKFTQYDCHIFVISVGAVVRMVAPLLVSKKVDPAVVCVDDDGRYAICTLSGHVGRGNQWTQKVASILGGEAVITTASDVRGTLMVDILGRDLGWTLADPDHNVTRGCAAVVNEEPVAFVQESGEPHWWPLQDPLPQGVSYFVDRDEIDPEQFGIVLLATDRSWETIEPDIKKNAVVYHPKSLVIGIGCDRGTPVDLLEEGVSTLLAQAGLAMASVAKVATIDLKGDEPGLLALCERHQWPLVTYRAEELDKVVGMENPSAMVQKHTGTRGVAEPSALLGAGAQKLLLSKQKYTIPGIGRSMTLAVARLAFEKRKPRVPASSVQKTPVQTKEELPQPQGFSICFEDSSRGGAPHKRDSLAGAPTSTATEAEGARSQRKKGGRLSLVGIGPGSSDHISPAALEAIREADIVVGYRTYMLLVRALIKGKKTIKTGMTEEITRAQAAVDSAAEGAYVALISSGDAGVYGMANLVFDVLKSRGWKVGMSPELKIIPGITALNSCASLVGAPLGHDSCMISLSDLLTPWEVIEKRIDAAAMSDFVIGLYNPASGRRQKQIVRAQEIIRRYRPGSTPVSLVKSAYRFRQQIQLTDLDHMLDFEIGMLTTVLIGNSHTYVYEGYMVTPRGYHNKYTWDGLVRDGQAPGESLRI